MPQAVVSFFLYVGDIIVAAVAGSGAFAAGGIAFGTTFSTIIGAIAVIGGTIGLSKLFEVEINVPDSDYSRQRTVKGTTVPVKVVYGEALVSGPIAFVGAGSTSNNTLYHVIALTGHRSEAITDIYFDNIKIQQTDIGTSPNYSGAVGGSTVYGQTSIGGTNQYITYINKHLGGDTTSDAMIDNNFAKWTSSHIGKDITYIATSFWFPDDENAAEVWNKYTPNDIKALVKGVKTIYDPRSDTSPGANPSSATYQSWSDNPALCLANYLVDTDFGMGVPATHIDWDSVVDSADYCDASITDPSGTVKRYTCNGVLFGTETHANNVGKLLSAMNGSLVYTNGVYVMNAGERLSPTVSLTEDDLAGHVTITAASKRSERFNTVTGIFNDPAQNHKQVEFPKVTIADVKNNRDNGEELSKQIQLSFTNDVYMAQRLAYQMVNRSNNQMVMDFPANLRGLKVAVGDRVQITLNAIAGPDGDTISFVNKVFMCTNFSFTDSSSGAVNLTLVEDYDGVNDYYADMPSNAYSTVNLADGTITDGFSGLQSPSAITATGVDQGIALDWTNPPSMPAGARVKIEEDDSVSSTYAGANIIRVYYTSGDFYNIFDIPANTTRQYWLSIIRGSDASPVAGPYSATSGEVLADSIDWLDVDNKLLALDLTGDTLSISATTTGTVTGNDIAESGIKQTIEIDSGGVIMNAGGVIKSLNKDTESDTDAGFFLGWNAAANSGSGSYTFGVGDGTDYLKYIDGTLTVSGTLSGVDGDFSGTIEIGSGNSIFKADGNGIYLGNATFASAPFSVTPDGEISSTSGTIGGFTLGSTSLSAGSGATTVSMSTADGIHLGATAFASAPFSVTPAGALTATDAQITGEINATSGDFSGQIAVGSTAGAITVIDGNNSDYRIFTNATLDTDTNQYLPDDSAFRVGNDGRVFASNITIYDNQGQILLSPTGLGAAALNNISNTSGSVVSTVGGELANSTSEITLTTSSASESFEISSKVAIDDNYDATQYTAGYSSVGVVDAESQLTSIQLIVDYYVRTDGGSYTSPAVSQTVSFTTSQSPTSSQITVNGYDRGSGYAGSLTRYFAVLQTYGGAMEALPNSGGGSTKYLLTSATLGSSNFPNAGTYKIKIVVRGVVSGTSTELTGSTTPPLSDGTTTGVGFDGANSDERIYDITGTGLIQTGTNTFVSGAQNLLSSGGVIDGNLTVSGTLTVNGGTTTINSTVVTVDDPIFTVGGDTAPASDDGKDRGIAFRWHQNPGTAQEGFFGFDRSTEKFTFIKFGTNSSEVFSGTRGDTDFRDVGGESLTLTKDTNFLTKFNEGNNYDATITIGSAGNFIVNRYSSSTTTEIFNLRSTGDLEIGGILTTGADGNSGDWYSAFTFVDALTASATELNYVDGVTSAIQTQLDAKAATTSLANYLPLAGGTLTGSLTVGNSGPVFVINDTDATNGTNQTGFISFQRQGTETAWIGYGSSGDDKFRVKNTEGVVYIENGAIVTGSLTATGNISFGSGADTGSVNFTATSDEGNYQIWHAGSAATNWGGAGSLNIYNSSGDINFHPSATDSTVEFTSTENWFARPININGGTLNGTNDATLYVTATNNADWGLVVNKYNTDATEYGVDIRMGVGALYALRVNGDGVQKFVVSGAGNVTTVGSVTASSFIGTATQATNLNATDDRDVAPEDLSYSDDFRIFFVDKGQFEGGTSNGIYLDLLYLNSYNDATGGDANALGFNKTTKRIYHYQADQAATTFGTAKSLAYTDDNISGTAAGLSGTPSVSLSNATLGTGNSDGVLSLKTYDDAENYWDLYTWTDDTFRINYNSAGADEFIMDSSGNVGLRGYLRSSTGIYGNTTGTWHSNNAMRGGNFSSDIANDTTALKLFPASPNDESSNQRAANDYSTGIGFMHLDPDANGWGTAFTGMQAWIGLRLHDTSQQERDFLTFATNNATTSGSMPIERMTLSPEGYLGINATDPAHYLDVGGNAKISGNLYLGSASQTEQDINYVCATGSWQVGVNASGNGTDSNQFFIYDDASSAYRLTVQKGTGRVGIGRTDPAQLLDVNGVSKFRDTMYFASSDEGLISWGSTLGDQDDTLGFGMLASSGNSLTLGAGGSWDQLVINSAGDVAVGHREPGHKLHVYDAAPTGGVIAKFESGNTSSWIQLTTTNESWQIGPSDGLLRFYNDDYGVYTYDMPAWGLGPYAVEGYLSGNLSFSASTNYSGWVRVAYSASSPNAYGSRGSFEVIVASTGGYFSPGKVVLKGLKDWGGGAWLSSAEAQGTQYFTEARISLTTNYAYLELKINGTINIGGNSSISVYVRNGGWSTYGNWHTVSEAPTAVSSIVYNSNVLTWSGLNNAFITNTIKTDNANLTTTNITGKLNVTASNQGWADHINLFSSDGSNGYHLLVDNGNSDNLRIARFTGGAGVAVSEKINISDTVTTVHNALIANGKITANAGLDIDSDAQLLTGHKLYFNGNTTYGIGAGGHNFNSGYFDTVESGGAADTLELCYYSGVDVKIGQGSYGSKPLYAGTLNAYTSTNDAQLALRGGDDWAGIAFSDQVDGTARSDYIWFHGANKTFAIGGGGSNVSGKKLHIDGGCTIGVDYDSTAMASNGLTVQGEIKSASNITAYASDERLKTNIKRIEQPLEKLQQINGVTFDWKDECESLGFNPTVKKNEIGVIAQEIQAVLPSAVTAAPFDIGADGEMGKSKSGQDYLTVYPEKIIPLLIESVKQLKTENDELKDLIKTIMEKLDDNH